MVGRAQVSGLEFTVRVYMERVPIYFMFFQINLILENIVNFTKFEAFDFYK